MGHVALFSRPTVSYISSSPCDRSRTPSMKMKKQVLIALCSVILANCSDSQSDPADGSLLEDESVVNASDGVDATADRSDSADTETTDTESSDAVSDIAPDQSQDVRDLPPPPLPDEPCPEPPSNDEPLLGRWSLSMFHYNVQYVAGGTEGFSAVTLGPGGGDVLDQTEAEVEDQIITESLVPLLGVLERNPELALTFEMQGYMVDVIVERHPRTLTRMRALVEAGQLELASIHWSDQFFLAFGTEDMDESWRRTQQSFVDANLPLSPVVFAQEGQFGEGFAEWVAERRPEAIAVMARNLQGFFQNGLAAQPLFEVSGLDVLLPRGISDALVERHFNFFDDGELLATNDMNPYFGDLFAYDPPSVGRYEHRLKCLAENGYRVGRIADYAEAVRESDFEPPEMPPFLDGTWQPRSTTGPLRWMGGGGQIWRPQERDNLVLTTCVSARHQVIGLQIAASDAGADAPQQLTNTLDEAWRHLLWGEVSDARGVNPWWGEVQYGLSHCEQAFDLAREGLLAEIERRDVDGLLIDTAEGVVTEELFFPEPLTRTPVDGPLEVTIVASGDREPTVSWFQIGESGDELFELEVSWPPIEGAVERFESCLARSDELEWACSLDPKPIAIQVPRMAGFVGYVPALSEAIVRYDESDFDLQAEAYEDGVWSTAANGLVDLGDAFFIKDVTQVHLAIGWPPGEGKNTAIEIRDETLQGWIDETWRFWYTPDESTAIELARRNLNPTLNVAP